MSAAPRQLESATASCGIALGLLAVVTAKQCGLIRHLPDPPGAAWDSDGLTDSKAAHPLGIPDGLLGMGSYGMTLGLLLTARESVAARRALRLKLAFDAGAASFNVMRQIVVFGKMCSWCMGTALATGGMVAFGWCVAHRTYRGEMGGERYSSLL